MKKELIQYGELLNAVKSRIQQAQTKAVLSANAEMLSLYWDIGQMIDRRQQEEGWGTGVVPRLSRDIRNQLPEIKGFSERNLKRMIRFYREYPDLLQNVPQPAALLMEVVWNIPWFHHVILFEKIKDISIRVWYIQQAIENGWSRNILDMQIKNKAHERAAKAVTNFEQTLPSPQSDLAKQSLKDPYIFDFLTIDEPFRERELETGLIRHLEKFLLELGQGFAFVGRQYHIDIGEDDFYIDLLFYHLKLRCYLVIELKRGKFLPEYAGKVNFYCNVVDDRLKHESDNQTIGLILCQDKNKVLAEYALRGMSKPIGISEYELTRALPDNLKSALPSIEEIESEFSNLSNDEV